MRTQSTEVKNIGLQNKTTVKTERQQHNIAQNAETTTITTKRPAYEARGPIRVSFWRSSCGTLCFQMNATRIT